MYLSYDQPEVPTPSLLAMQKPDRRIRRTQRAFIDALITLSLEKGYDSITIRDITDRADVAYSTFFRHYAHKDELLADVLQAVIHDFMVLINQGVNKTHEDEGRLIFQYVADHQAFFRVLFSSQGTNSVLQNMQNEIAQTALRLNPHPPNSPIPPEIAANHLVATVIALIRWWLDHETPYPVEQMATIYSHLITPGLAASETSV